MTDATEPEILVTAQKLHGMPVDRLVAALEDRYDPENVSLARTETAIREAIGGATVVLGESINASLLEDADALKLFACSYAGTDHLPLDALAERDVTVTNAGGVHASNAAEHAVGALLGLTRGLFRAHEQQRERRWQHFRVGELAEGTVTVVGLGAIGTAIAERLAPFDVTIYGVRHSPEKGGPVDAVYGYDEFEDAITETDAIVLACPLTETTRHLLDDAVFDVLHPDAVIVNVARGGVIDTDALVSAIRSNHIGGAALDVTDPEPLPEDHPLWTFDDVLITPHNAGYTPKYYERLADIVVGNVERAIETGSWTGLQNQIVP